MAAFPTSSKPTPPDSGRGRSVLLLVTGGIAAYKSCWLARRLHDAGCKVRVAMTEAATRFVTPLTFESLTGQSVGTTLWGEGGEAPLDHIYWARDADLIVVAPATADFIAKMSLGLAGDLPSTLATAASSPILVAPAMNDRMWSNPPNQEHIQRLRDRGVHVLDPGSGALACGTVAEGRLAEPDVIAERALSLLMGGPLAGKRVVVTAGPTREPIDAVRYVGNRSSGRMGMAMAEAARDLGAEVTLLLGPTELPAPSGMRVERFETADQLGKLTKGHAAKADAVAMVAAVADYRPAKPHAGKLKKGGGVPDVALEPTEDILAALGQNKPEGQCLIGFALETGSDVTVEKETRRKLVAKKLDLACGNHADRDGEGFGAVTNRIFVARGDGTGDWTETASKSQLARTLWDEALRLFARAKTREEKATP